MRQSHAGAQAPDLDHEINESPGEVPSVLAETEEVAVARMLLGGLQVRLSVRVLEANAAVLEGQGQEQAVVTEVQGDDDFVHLDPLFLVVPVVDLLVAVNGDD